MHTVVNIVATTIGGGDGNLFNFALPLQPGIIILPVVAAALQHNRMEKITYLKEFNLKKSKTWINKK